MLSRTSMRHKVKVKTSVLGPLSVINFPLWTDIRARTSKWFSETIVLQFKRSFFIHILFVSFLLPLVNSLISSCSNCIVPSTIDLCAQYAFCSQSPWFKAKDPVSSPWRQPLWPSIFSSSDYDAIPRPGSPKISATMILAWLQFW